MMWKVILVFFVSLDIFTTGASVPRLDGRIVGGANTNITSYPYQVSLRKRSLHVCGGSIFHSYYILTAAHCVASGLAKSYSVRVGSTYANQGGTVFDVCSVRVHANYNAETMNNDIAILTLCKPLVFSASVLPIALPESSETAAAGVIASVSGWGYMQEDGTSVSKILQQVKIPIVSQKTCISAYEYELITKNMICAGYMGKGGMDACQGDSGGPLMANGKLFGIVSWGNGCARPKYPGVYTNVPLFREWIRQYTKY